jgi:hypothetical protein
VRARSRVLPWPTARPTEKGARVWAGTYADVFLGREVSTDRYYAVKRLNEGDDERRAANQSEIDAMVRTYIHTHFFAPL